MYENETAPTSLPEYLNDAASLISMAIQVRQTNSLDQNHPFLCYLENINILFILLSTKVKKIMARALRVTGTTTILAISKSKEC